MIVSFIIEGLNNRPMPIFATARKRALSVADDMVEGLIRLMFYPNTNGQIINLGSPKNTVLEFLLKKVKKLLSSTSEIILSENYQQMTRNRDVLISPKQNNF